MLKRICCCLFLLISTGVFAQHYVGIKGIQGISTISALPDFRKRSLNTFSPGIVYRYEHQKYTAIQVEVNYINKGYIREQDTLAMTPDITERISSIEVPLMAQGFVRLGHFRPYLTGGVTAGYILQRTTEEKGSKPQDYISDEYDRKFEYGIAGGGGLGVSVSRFEMQFELRYVYNFAFLRTPVIENRPNTYLNSTQLMISFSLLYKLGK